MTLPNIGTRKDAVVMIAFDTNSPSTFTNACGCKNFNIDVNNEIHSEKVGDCEDWEKPIETLKSYSAQNVTASMDATWSSKTHVKMSAWAMNQLYLPVRIHFPFAASGEIEYYDGVALLTSLNIANIGNTDGAPITESISLEFDGGLQETLKT